MVNSIYSLCSCQPCIFYQTKGINDNVSLNNKFYTPLSLVTTLLYLITSILHLLPIILLEIYRKTIAIMLLSFLYIHTFSNMHIFNKRRESSEKIYIISPKCYFGITDLSTTIPGYNGCEHKIQQ